jgi:hypothetical protein
MRVGRMSSQRICSCWEVMLRAPSFVHLVCTAPRTFNQRSSPASRSGKRCPLLLRLRVVQYAMFKARIHFAYHFAYGTQVSMPKPLSRSNDHHVTTTPLEVGQPDLCFADCPMIKSMHGDS